MAEETKEIKGFGNWVRENSRGIVIAGVFGLGGLFVGYAIKNNAQQNRAYRQDIIGVLEKVVQQDPNQAKVLVEAIKPKEPVKEEARDIKKAIEKEAEEIAKHEDKYIRVLEERVRLREEKDALTSERDSLKQKYDELNKSQAPLLQKYNKSLEDLTATSAQKTTLEAKQKDLIKQVADVNDALVKLTKEKNKLNEDYVTELLARKTADANSVEVTVKLVELNKKYMQLLEEKTKLEKDVLRVTLNYNSMLEKVVSRSRSLYPSAPRSETPDIGLRQINRIRNTKGLEIVFFEGNIDAAEKVDYERTDLYSDEELKDKMGKNKNYAFLVDFNGDGKKDLIYDGDMIGEDKLKEGRADGTFTHAKTIPNKTALQFLGRYILKHDIGIELE